MAEHRWLIGILSGAVLWCTPGWSWAAPVVVTIAPEAQVQGPQMTLGEVAAVRGESADTVTRLQQVVLGQAPARGVERRLSRYSIITQLKHQGFAVQELRFEGATQIRVTRVVQRLDPRAQGQEPLRQPLTQPVIQKGDLVRIVIESSVMKVTMTGQALEAGKPGDTIRVKNTSSNREIRAQVIDKHTVGISL